jgi:N-methylhydantoinase A
MDQLHIHERSVYLPLYDALTRSLYSDYDELNGIIDDLKERGVRDIVRQGHARDQVEFRVELDMRYGDQLQLTSMVVPFGRFDGGREVLEMIKRYHTSYGERFGEGTQTPETGIKVNQVRVISYVPLPKVSFATNGASSNGHNAKRKPVMRNAWFDDGLVETPVYDLAAVAPGEEITGNAIVESANTTFVVYPGWTLRELDNHFIEMRRTA